MKKSPRWNSPNKKLWTDVSGGGLSNKLSNGALRALPYGKSRAAHMMLQKVVKNIPNPNLKMRYRSKK